MDQSIAFRNGTRNLTQKALAEAKKIFKLPTGRFSALARSGARVYGNLARKSRTMPTTMSTTKDRDPRMAVYMRNLVPVNEQISVSEHDIIN